MAPRCSHGTDADKNGPKSPSLWIDLNCQALIERRRDNGGVALWPASVSHLGYVIDSKCDSSTIGAH